MKKQFFYAALAIGMMSSCSSNDLPGNQAPEEQLPEEERVAIELGISSPNAKIEASTKGAGPVGSTAEESNKWKGQDLKILMFGSDNALAKEGGQYILNGLDFKAPVDEQSGSIGMYTTGSYTDNQNYTKEYRYYPQTGKYSFYGYYADDATVDPVYPQEDGKFTVTIDGTQDILTAQTAPLDTKTDGQPATSKEGTAYAAQDITESDWTKIVNQSFSAWSARRKVVPILNFKHNLARFRFFVKAGEADAATQKYEGDTWTDKETVTVGSDPNVKKGVFITRLVTAELTNSFAVDLINNSVTAGSSKAKYILRSVDAQGKPEDAVDENGTTTGSIEYLKTPVAPKQFGNDAQEKTTFVGDIMFFPEETVTEIPCELNLKQAILVKEIVTNNVPSEVWEIKKSDPITFSIKTTDIKQGETAIQKFEAGKQYDITIIVYGYQKIEITAALSAWVEGGAGEFNPSDDFSE